MKRELEFDWFDVDFRPSTLAGWRAVYLYPNAERGRSVEPLAGWLIQEQRAYYADTLEPAEDGHRPFRRVVPARCTSEGEVENVTDFTSFWRLLAPGDPTPTAEEEASERARRGQQVTP